MEDGETADTGVEDADWASIHVAIVSPSLPEQAADGDEEPDRDKRCRDSPEQSCRPRERLHGASSTPRRKG
jgi:hypothetical protein